MYSFTCPTLAQKCTYHTLVPDDGHPLLGTIDAFGDQAEVVFAHGALRRVEGTVCASRHLQVAAVQKVSKGGGKGRNLHAGWLVGWRRLRSIKTYLTACPAGVVPLTRRAAS